MFTSRAEYRLMLREDNADLRLTEKGRELGLVDDQRWAAFDRKREMIEQEQQRLQSTWLHPEKISKQEQQRVLKKPLSREANLMDLLRRPDVNYQDLTSLSGLPDGVTDAVVAEQVEIQAKYSGYIDRQRDEIARHKRHEQTRLPEDLDYDQVKGLSLEVAEKLKRIRPATLGQAGRISGVTPAAVSLLLIHMKKRTNKAARELSDKAG